MAVEAIIFDLDGTLAALHAAPGGERARRLWVATEIPLNYAMLLLDRTGLSRLLHGPIDRARRLKGIGTRNTFTCVPGAEDALGTLAHEYALAVVTNRGRPEAQAFLERSRIGRYVSALVTREDVWRLKPHPAAILHAAALLGVSPEKTWFVGDLPLDMRAARRSGARPVGVRTGFCTSAELKRAGADLVVDSVCDLPAALR